HQFCLPADEPRSALQRFHLRTGRGAVLFELCSMRGAFKLALMPLRSAPLAVADHDHLGCAGHRHDVRADAAAVLRAPLSAGRGRGGLLSRRGLLSYAVVSAGDAGPCNQPLLRVAAPELSSDGRTCGSTLESARAPRPGRMAVAVSG